MLGRPGVRVPPEVCIECKGARRLCGLPRCPLLASARARLRISLRLGSDGRLLDGSSPPSVVVGEEGYPRVRVYLGVPPEVYGLRAKIFDSPKDWHLRLGLTDIIELRSNLVYASLKLDVRRPEVLYEKEVGLAGVSSRPVTMEAQLLKPPKALITFNPYLPPRGPSSPASKVRVVENPSLSRKLESLIWDDVKASEAVWELFMSGEEFYNIVRALTLGFLGRRVNRRVVPTRWGITATDSILTTRMLKDVRTSPTVNDVKVYYGEYLHNKYTIIIYPGNYSSVWIEVWRPHSLWNPSSKPSILIVKDDFRGVPNLMDGGFLAAREAVVEYLWRVRKQGKVVILREVEPQYLYPVGNWQIRMTVARALRMGEVLRNPTPNELKEFLMKVHKVPKDVISYVIKLVYGIKYRSLMEFIKK